jgi:hypothetical protein
MALTIRLTNEWTAERVAAALGKDENVAKALRALYARQTADEQATEETHHLNRRGFSAGDAKVLTNIAKKLERYGSLTTNQTALVRIRLQKYCRQLAAIYNEASRPAAARDWQVQLTRPSASENPWKGRHIDAETAFQDGDAQMASHLVELEYRDAPEALDCHCGGHAYWRATVGAMQCPDCRSLFSSQGDLIHDGRNAAA